MGADLYIPSIYDQYEKDWRERFDAACAVRDATWRFGSGQSQNSPEQKRVAAIFDERYTRPVEEVGYLRDSYNTGSVFWYLGHSWWGLAESGGANCFSEEPVLNGDGFITPEDAGRIAERCTVEPPDVRTYLESLDTAGFLGQEERCPERLAEWTAHFREGQLRLVQFFRLAATLGEPVRASI